MEDIYKGWDTKRPSGHNFPQPQPISFRLRNNYDLSLFNLSISLNDLKAFKLGYIISVLNARDKKVFAFVDCH